MHASCTTVDCIFFVVDACHVANSLLENMNLWHFCSLLTVKKKLKKIRTVDFPIFFYYYVTVLFSHGVCVHQTDFAEGIILHLQTLLLFFGCCFIILQNTAYLFDTDNCWFFFGGGMLKVQIVQFCLSGI